MALGLVDLGIVVAYLLVTLGIGVYFSRRAAGSIDEYFLGGRSLPWYILGISGVATFIDVSGTMVQSSFFYMLGVKGYWVAYRGAIALLLSFLMIFMGKWLNRTRAMTNSELIAMRFGSGAQGHLSRILTSLSILITVVAFAAYFFVGSSKFLGEYFPFFSPDVAALLFFVLIMIYTVLGGFYGVVFTDLFQSVLILGLIVFFTVKAMMIGTPEYLARYASTDWLALIPHSWTVSMPAGYEAIRPLGWLILFWIASNILQGFGVPFDAWTSQRYYAARSEREAGLVACQWIVLFGLRFPLMMAIGVLALGLSAQITEPEMALNAVVNTYAPIGVKGLLFSALLAAAMSTLNALINSSAAYFVRDIYQTYLVPSAGRKRLVVVSYLTTITIMVLGVILGWQAETINAVWSWICMGLFTGILAPNIMKWFWWRFNGAGYAAGMASGLIAAILQQMFWTKLDEIGTFLVVFGITAVGTVVGVFLGRPTDPETLVKFYKTVRPFGFWGPVRAKCDPQFVAGARKENRRDLLLLGPACVWQCVMYWMMTSFVVRKWDAFALSAAIVAVTSWILYKYWYVRLAPASQPAKPPEAAEAHTAP